MGIHDPGVQAENICIALMLPDGDYLAETRALGGELNDDQFSPEC